MKISFPWQRERREKYVIFLSLWVREKNVNHDIFPREILREKNIPLKGDNFPSLPGGQAGVSSRAVAYARRLLPLIA